MTDVSLDSDYQIQVYTAGATATLSCSWMQETHRHEPCSENDAAEDKHCKHLQRFLCLLFMNKDTRGVSKVEKGTAWLFFLYFFSVAEQTSDSV